MQQLTETDVLQRCRDFELRREIESAEHTEDLGEGLSTVLSPTIPLVWDANYLLLEEPGLEAAQLAARADAIFGGLGMAHRTVKTRRPALADELSDDFVELGWDPDRTVNMVLRREPDRPAGGEVEQVRREVTQPLRRTLMQEYPWTTPDAAPQLIELDRRMAEVVGDRSFAAFVDGRVASACRLYQAGGVGQVEHVETLPEYRNRGLARAVVTAAIEAAQADGDELIFLTADAGDWPRRLYARIGFDEVGVSVAFRRRPPPV
jgi:GNAT superfamily N-acetyltransferase